MTIAVSDLAIGRSGQVLLAGLDFAVGPGEALLLTGPNGAGKTTLLRTLAGLLPVIAGRIDRSERFLFGGLQDGMKPQFTVLENLSFAKALQGEGDVDQALDSWNLTALKDRFAADLSAGQRRRLALARLSLAPLPLWLLDEPTVSLDSASTALFETALADHLANGGAAVIATHLPVGGKAVRQLALAPQKAATLDLEALW